MGGMQSIPSSDDETGVSRPFITPFSMAGRLTAEPSVVLISNLRGGRTSLEGFDSIPVRYEPIIFESASFLAE